jgi:hypothetical protein
VETCDSVAVSAAPAAARTILRLDAKVITGRVLVNQV